MSRPSVIWSVLVVCGLLIVGAMGWLTRRTLEMEQQQAVAEARAKLEERVRLAMSRMDAVASAMLVIENERPPEHYQAFYEPKAVFTRTLQPVEGGVVMQPSPLLSEVPEFVKVHFEVWADRMLTSPQVPVGNERDLAEASGVGPQQLDDSKLRLDELRGLLAAPAAAQGGPPGDNLSQMIEACVPGATAWNELPLKELEQKSQWMGSQLKEVVQNAYAFGNSDQQSTYQQDLTIVDRGNRLKAYEEVQSRASKSAGKKSQVLSNKVESSLAMRSSAGRDAVPAPSAVGVAPQEVPQVEARQSQEELRMAEVSDAPAEHQEAKGGMLPVVEGAAEPVKVSPFRPIWLDGELVAVRRVRSVDSGIRYQGFWLDAAQLRASMIEGIADLLPDATLTPVQEWTDGAGGMLPQASSRTLVTLPWVLHEGVQVDPMLAAVVPFPASLGIGWVAVVLAMLAAAVLVRGVLKMSERRAAFVSSVTHELRTPLTTFQLYSDLLAEGMVRDEDKRQSYLETLRSEAGRLNHLIENVLSYSRIERGSARARRERIALGDLVGRFRRRLDERALHDQARIEVVGLENCAEVEFETDVTAVEQIVFNLVDNACKYGLPDDGERVVALRVDADRRHVSLAVCDAGSGISWRDRRRLFRPFHKSANDAANSKPGVGLGLALCRRLAKALGGDLKIDCKREKGACFVLRVPRVRR